MKRLGYVRRYGCWIFQRLKFSIDVNLHIKTVNLGSVLNKIYNVSLLWYFMEQKLEGRVATDEDLKLSDTLRYYMKDSQAAKDLLYRRARALADYENANKALEKARLKNKEVAQVKLTKRDL